MDVQTGRASRLRRLARSRALALLTLYGAAAVVATAPAITSFRSSFLAGGEPGMGGPGAGDHLQSVYRFWLFGHQLEQGALPWRDVYSFQPLVPEQTVLAAWPFGIPFWPLDALFGPVVAWNTLTLTVIVLAGLLTYGWLRLLPLSTGAAAVGGLAFALAPYRLAQSTGHLLGWVAVFLPLALWAFERSRTASTPGRQRGLGLLSALALLSFAFAGQVHLSLAAIPFAVAYVLLRDRRAALWPIAGAVGAAAAGIALRLTVIADSTASGGRTLDQVEMFQAGWLDLVSRFRSTGFEQFTYVGWLTPILAIAGLTVLWRSHRALAALLGVAVVVPLVFAVGTNTPIYAPIWRHFPPLHFTRVPERLVPVAALALAVLAAVAVGWLERRARPSRRSLVAVVAAVFVVGDLLVLPFHATAADPGNAAYAALAGRPGRAVELPLFEPGIHYGSIYDYYQLQAPTERPGGYSTLAPPAAYDYFWERNRLNCGLITRDDLASLRRLGATSLLFELPAYRQAARPSAWHAWTALQRLGLRAEVRGGGVWLYGMAPAPGGTPPQAPPVAEPPRSTPILCEGWIGFTMKERDAPMWLYTGSDVELTLSAPGKTQASVRVDLGPPYLVTVDGEARITVEIAREGWHSILLAVPELFLEARPPQGLTIERLRYLEPGEG